MALTKIPGELINIDDLDLTNVGTLHLDSIVSDASPAAITVGYGINDTLTINGSTILEGAVTVNESSADVDFRVESNGDTHRLFIDGGNDRILIGTTASRAMSGVTPDFFIEGTSYADSGLGAVINANGAIDCPVMLFGKSRGTSLGSNTVVQNGDRLFTMRFDGSDGTNLEQAALIEAYVDAAPGANEIPGRLSFWTTTAGSQYSTEKMRIDNAGKVGIGVTPSSSWDANIDCLQVGEQSSIWAGDTDYSDATWLGLNVYQTGGATKYLTSSTAAVYGMQAGQHYWYSYASGSADATVSGNEVMRIDTAGHVTKPLQPAFSAVVGTATTDVATNASRNTVGFTTEIFDNNADYNATASTFTAPVAGRYQLNASLYVLNSDAEATYIRIEIRTSNRDYTYIFEPNYSADRGRDQFTISVLADMDASDTALVDIGQYEGTAQMDVPASPQSHFSGFLAC